MVHSLELLLDDDADQRVRTEWAQLAAAGLPHQGTVRSGTNRPHATLLVAEHIADSVHPALAPAAMSLPIALRLGAPLLFGQGSKVTLARLVVPSSDLLSVHATVGRLAADHLGDDPHLFPHGAPGQWTPHVTLARRLTPEQVAEAIGVLDLRSEIAGTFSALRHWNGDDKTERVLPGRAC
ncbi:2'-5' RNA ligase family protein [Gordonia sp. CPCC 205515]|uniref:2'-5' RNA ligase family protein n=1 Tax=Gordonia sp. CPCC 205515 TaxID=3140791 RepID=UPI003AF35983